MPMGVLFWLLFILWTLAYFWWYWPEDRSARAVGPAAVGVLLFALLFLLGWRVFGFVVN